MTTKHQWVNSETVTLVLTACLRWSPSPPALCTPPPPRVSVELLCTYSDMITSQNIFGSGNNCRTKSMLADLRSPSSFCTWTSHVTVDSWQIHKRSYSGPPVTYLGFVINYVFNSFSLTNQGNKFTHTIKQLNILLDRWQQCFTLQIPIQYNTTNL